jgi:hypothetical protein
MGIGRDSSLGILTLSDRQIHASGTHGDYVQKLQLGKDYFRFSAHGLDSYSWRRRYTA